MKKGLFLLSLIVTFYALGTVSASAVTNDTVKVGLRYGSSVMSSANLENDEGAVTSSGTSRTTDLRVPG